jgi:hypothetical protein
MEATTRNLRKLLEPSVQYQVPLFQRPYVWKQDDNWMPLWEDIEALLDKHLYQGSAHPHFLGAAVFELATSQSGAVQTRLVIDGQQRFTTLQLFLMAARNLSRKVGSEKQTHRLGALVENGALDIDEEVEKYKLLPTNADRAAFMAIHACSSDDEVRTLVKADKALAENRLVEAYLYFAANIAAWVNGDDVDVDRADEFARTKPEDRIECIWKVVTEGLLLVVIDLTAGDESQLIFETLNHRGEPLLPADLIKNLLFRKAIQQPGAKEGDVEKLHEKHWRRIDSDYWREEVTQGRLKRPRIDLFINHYLSMMLREEVRATHLFNEYKRFFENSADVSVVGIDTPKTPSEHIIQLAKFGDIFQEFYKPDHHPELALFLRRLSAINTATVYPFLLYSYARLMPDNRAEFNKILVVLESFLMRRWIVNLTPKNYNRFFVDLIKAVERSGELTARSVSEQLIRGVGDSSKFPTDDELRVAVFEKPLYTSRTVTKSRTVLEALDDRFRSGKSEALTMPTNLTVEHVMPQSWEKHWPLPSSLTDDVERIKFAARRNMLIHTLGNLTLITGEFNSGLQHKAWGEKKPELLRYSKLNLTQYFHNVESWGEDEVRARGEVLFAEMVKMWPVPEGTP